MAKSNLTKYANIDTTAREVDFVTRFANNWEHLRDIMGVTRIIRKTPGTVLKSKYAEVTLQSGAVGEGEEIPYSQAEVKTKDYAAINVEKFAKGVSIEAINEHGCRSCKHNYERIRQYYQQPCYGNCQRGYRRNFLRFG